MPEQTAPPPVRDIDLERASYHWEGQTIDDRRAVTLVTQTFGKYESDRKRHEDRWRTAERLYFGVMEKRFWKNTEVERASLPVMICFDQVESAYPIISDELFNHQPTFFEVLAKEGTHPAEAAQIRDVIYEALTSPYDEKGLTAIPHLENALHQTLIYGDGLCEVSWDNELKRPVVEWADLKDIFVDQSALGPLLDLSPAVIHRKLLTVEELRDLRDVEGVNIPPDAVLNYLAKLRYTSTADTTRRDREAARNLTLNVTDLRVDPRHQQVEVLVYWTKDRLIWVLGRTWTAINQPNEYGFIPYVKAPFIVVPGCMYSISAPDVLEAEQKYAQGIRNARLDNLSLALNPPRVRPAGAPMAPSKLAWQPGLIDEVGASVERAEVFKIENITADAYREEQLIHMQAQNRLGVNQFVQSGVPTPSNANRSATGVARQTQAVNQRLRTGVKNFEDYLIVPLLYKIQRMYQKFAPEVFETMTPAGNAQTVTRDTFSRTVKFRMEAASRMVTKDRLGMFLGPVSQLLFNDVVMQQANVQGKTIDFNEWVRFFQDATGTARTYQFFRDMSEQEKAESQRPDPKMVAEMQKAQLEAQTRLQMGQMKARSEMETTKMKVQGELQETGEKSARDILKVLGQERSGSKSAGEEGSRQPKNR